MPPELEAIVLPFIKAHEGCKLLAYTDQGGRVTIGWGHTGNIALGTQWSQEQADDALIADITRVLEQVEALVRVTVNNRQLAALTSFTYNLGTDNLRRSGLLRLLNLRRYAEAAKQFPLWCHIGMYASPGLLKRREDEMNLFNSKDDNEEV